MTSRKLRHNKIILEWEDNEESLPQTISLYHGTDFEGINNIIEQGVIDANNGRQRGETKGMNWFFTEHNNSFSKGYMFSIEVDKSEFDNYTFNFMNRKQVSCYKPIDINTHNFKIVTAFHLSFEDLYSKFKNYVEQNDDIYDAYFDFFENVILPNETENDIFADSPIMIQLLKQFGYDEHFMRDNLGLIECIHPINEVETSDISLSSFDVKDELNPKIWVNDKLNSRVRLRLLDIADDFIDELSMDWVKPEDIVFTGSLANYNWSKYSDIDIHILLDYKKVYKNKDFVKDYFDCKKEIWSDTHPNLKIYGYPVEIYVEDVSETNYSSGIYSLNKNKWIKEPKDFQDAKLNATYIKKYAAKLMTDIDNIINKLKKETDEHKINVLSNKLKKIFDKAKNLRTEGLKKGGEMASGNIIWKILRRTEYLDKLWTYVNKSYDRLNSIK